MPEICIRHMTTYVYIDNLKRLVNIVIAKQLRASSWCLSGLGVYLCTTPDGVETCHSNERRDMSIVADSFHFLSCPSFHFLKSWHIPFISFHSFHFITPGRFLSFPKVMSIVACRWKFPCWASVARGRLKTIM